MDYGHQFLKALFLTVVIESACLFLLFRGVFRQDRRVLSDGLLLFAGIVPSALTLPYLWFVLPYFVHSQLSYVLGGEFSVMIVEAALFFVILRIGMKRSVLTSVLCNGVSFLLGLFLMRL